MSQQCNPILDADAGTRYSSIETLDLLYDMLRIAKRCKNYYCTNVANISNNSGGHFGAVTSACAFGITHASARVSPGSLVVI